MAGAPQEPGERTLKILASFVKSLTHDLRTPLSVISNDLFCIQSIVSNNECERGVSKCKEISTILERVASFADDDVQFKKLLVVDVLSKCGLHFVGEIKPNESEVLGSEGALCFVFSIIREIFKSPEITIKADQRVSVLLRTPSSQRPRVEPCAETIKYFKELGVILGRKDSYLLSLLDAIILAHQGETKICAGSIIEAELSFPRALNVSTGSTDS